MCYNTNVNHGAQKCRKEDHMVIAVIIIILAVAIGVFIGLQNAKKYKASLQSGKILKREASFYEDKEIFRAFIGDQSAFYNALTEAIKTAGVCSSSGNYNSTVSFKGSNWSAQLTRLQSEDGSTMYSFGVTNIQYGGGRTQYFNPYDLNVLLTAIEKVFLQFDINTLVYFQAINFKTKHDLI